MTYTSTNLPSYVSRSLTKYNFPFISTHKHNKLSSYNFSIIATQASTGFLL